MKLLIVIPALNEEESIAGVIEACLASRARLIAETPVTEVVITVVSDGSTDATLERARAFEDRIEVISLPVNRGYGAAIQTGWSSSDADLLAFLDADGTCDPDFFVPLIQALEEQEADVVLGNRMGEESEMPWLRRFGNVLFAWMLSVLAHRRIRDTASGMRVVRRSSLPILLPLPDGLHFTPAMSARVVLSDRLRIAEVDMPYRERRGRSKLRVVEDGLRFLTIIAQTALLYRPHRPLFAGGVLMAIGAVVLMARPTLFYLENGYVEEWMIYRFVVAHLMGLGACLLWCAAYLAGSIAHMTVTAHRTRGRPWNLLERFFRSRLFYLVPILFTVVGIVLVTPGFVEIEHWSRFIVMSGLLSMALVLVSTKAIDHVVRLIEARLDYLASQQDEPGPSV